VGHLVLIEAIFAQVPCLDWRSQCGNESLPGSGGDGPKVPQLICLRGSDSGSFLSISRQDAAQLRESTLHWLRDGTSDCPLGDSSAIFLTRVAEAIQPKIDRLCRPFLAKNVFGLLLKAFRGPKLF
jgi:hypothetical protein